jgi:hemerythrin-like domain-containing protein
VNHHPTEDLIFAKLVQYVPESRMTCNRLTKQHRSFGRQEVTMLWHLRSARCGDEDSRERVRDMSISYCADHSRHIHSEELDVFPQAVRCLSSADWKDVEDHSNQINDPVFEKNELRRFDNLYDYLMAEGKRFDMH